MIIVDTNIIGALYLSNQHSVQAERLLLMEPLWSAPLLWRSEFRNVLALYVRKKWIKLEDAQQMMAEAIRLMRDREYDVASHQVLNLVSASTCSAYDCEFVALAKDLGAPLITADKQILSQFPQIAVSVETFINERSL